MSFTPLGRIKSVEEFRAYLHDASPGFDCDDALEGADGPLGLHFEVPGSDGSMHTIGNRFCIQPMEGWDGTAEGGPTEHTLRRWRRFGESGAKLVWGGEAFAVQHEGRANPNQLFHNPEADNAANLELLLGELRAAHRNAFDSIDDLYVGLQLTHSGRFSRPDGEMAPLLVEKNPLLASKYDLPDTTHVLTDGELHAIRDNFVEAARTAAKAGFDFVDVKACHGYVVHELLGARTRKGEYGGTFENRTRFFREVVEAIRNECPELAIGCRVSITDLVPFVADPESRTGIPMTFDGHLPWQHGFGIDESNPLESDFTEPVAFLELARSLGVSMANLSVGSPYYCPHFQRPAAYPPSDGYLPPQDPLLEVLRHLSAVRTVKASVPDLPLVGSGYSYLQEWLPFIAQHEIRQGHVDFIGLGRSMLAYHDLPADVLAGGGLDRKRFCRTFSDCTTAPRNGMISGCYPLDEHYKTMPQAQDVRVLRNKAAKGES